MKPIHCTQSLYCNVAMYMCRLQGQNLELLVLNNVGWMRRQSWVAMRLQHTQSCPQAGWDQIPVANAARHRFVWQLTSGLVPWNTQASFRGVFSVVSCAQAAAYWRHSLPAWIECALRKRAGSNPPAQQTFWYTNDAACPGHGCTDLQGTARLTMCHRSRWNSVQSRWQHAWTNQKVTNSVRSW